VLIVNLGTPEGTDYWSIRRYLKEFLSDRRVIETPRALWLPILQFILLRRPRARGRDYDAIWNREREEGPLKTITRSQAEKLGLALVMSVERFDRYACRSRDLIHRTLGVSRRQEGFHRRIDDQGPLLRHQSGLWVIILPNPCHPSPHTHLTNNTTAVTVVLCNSDRCR